jgi:hypothetical protein
MHDKHLISPTVSKDDKMISMARFPSWQYEPIWFHAWKCEQEDNLWAALIQTVIGRGTIHSAWYWRWWAKLRIRLRGFRPFAGTVEVGRSLAVLSTQVLFIAFCVLLVANRNNLGSLLAPPSVRTWSHGPRLLLLSRASWRRSRRSC